ncbi:hypothetical protein [Prochlorothrix hollandica]|uniref:Uncharacterized protein n=1 Tax=Prochlorothrix hollandica PCC 9006 = CALU 1027 TaxID=317619 RepID=A0A0M2PXW8_PROHO|nr:hypothetical protein [Prochlorothrix hollandica]KKI99513.1 hypothetical protein PROH_13050 [Prochlorothrix hollandica PCC 9006 = CALU 1027]
MTEKPIKRSELNLKKEDESGDRPPRPTRSDRTEGRDRDQKGGRRKGRDDQDDRATAVPLALVRGPKPNAKAKPGPQKVTSEAEEGSDEAATAETPDAPDTPETDTPA